MRLRDSHYPYVLTTIFFFACAIVLTRTGLRSFSPFPMATLRFIIASLTLAPIMLHQKMNLPKGKDWLWFIASGMCGFFLYSLVFNTGCVSVTAATSSIVIATVPVMTAALASLIWKEKLSALQWVSIVIEFFGVVLLCSMSDSFTWGGGLFWLLVGAVLLSCYNLLQRKLTRTYPALLCSALSIFLGTIPLLIFVPGAMEELKTATGAAIWSVVILGVFSTAVAYVCWTIAFQKAKMTTQVSNFMFLTPFVTALLGFFIAGETIEPSALLGGGVVLLGLALFLFGPKLLVKEKQN